MTNWISYWIIDILKLLSSKRQYVYIFFINIIKKTCLQKRFNLFHLQYMVLIAIEYDIYDIDSIFFMILYAKEWI